jgi:UDP-N-acetylmuramate dehydrogenase
MLGRITGAVRFKEPLSFHTSLRIGGPAEFFIVPQDVDDVRHALAFAHQEDLPLIVLGGGNNMLVSERGVQAVVLKLQGVLSRAEFHGDEVVVGGGVGLSALIREAAARDLGGLESLAGIPATVGGALATGAGTRDGCVADACAAIYFLHPDGTLGEFRSAGAAEAFQVPAGGVVLGARLRLTRRPQAKIVKELQQRLKIRKSTQPFALASAGYVWKNPGTETAERLLQAAGVRGKRVNAAEISPKSPNFIVNRGNATAADVLALMDLMRDRVEAQTGIVLETDIKLIGFEAYAPGLRPAAPAAARKALAPARPAARPTALPLAV